MSFYKDFGVTILYIFLQAELEETAKAVANATPRSGMSLSSSTHSPSRGSSRSELEEEQAGKDFSTVGTTPQPSPKKSPMDVIFSDNRVSLMGSVTFRI